MKIARIFLSTMLGISLFYSSSAVSQMSAPPDKSVAQTEDQKQISTVQETDAGPSSLLADFYYSGLGRSTETGIQDLQGSEGQVYSGFEDGTSAFEMFEQFRFIEDADFEPSETVVLEIQKAKAFSCSRSDRILIARVVYAESRGEKFEGQVAVATVVLNRYYSGEFGSSIRSIVFAPDQFAIMDKYNQTSLKAVDEAISSVGDYPENMFYFRVSKSRIWRNFKYYTRIGGHSFYLSAE